MYVSSYPYPYVQVVITGTVEAINMATFMIRGKIARLQTFSNGGNSNGSGNHHSQGNGYGANFANRGDQNGHFAGNDGHVDAEDGGAEKAVEAQVRGLDSKMKKKNPKLDPD